MSGNETVNLGPSTRRPLRLLRKRQEARKLGEYLQGLGLALIQEPEQIDLGKFGATYRLDAIGTLTAEIVRLNDHVRTLKQDMRDRKLAE